MIQIVDKPNLEIIQEVTAYLAGLSDDAGVCGEHDPRWLGVFREALGHRPMMLIAREGRGQSEDDQQEARRGLITGYLPLCLVSSCLFGRFLVSLPYLNRAGVVADGPETATQLAQEAVALAGRLKVRYLELRHFGPALDWFGQGDWVSAVRDDKQRMVLTLPDNDEALWKSVGPKVRNQVRKGDKHELGMRWGGQALLEDFYGVFAVNMRDLGTPVYPKQLFGLILERFGSDAELAVVDYQGRPVAGALLVHDGRGSTQVPSASSLREFNTTNANMWMYHRLLLRTIEKGGREFDFGRSSVDSGTYRFKKQWGAQPQPTVWHYHVYRGDISGMRPDSPQNQRRVAMWKKLPLWLTRWAGPMIVRGIP